MAHTVLETLQAAAEACDAAISQTVQVQAETIRATAIMEDTLVKLRSAKHEIHEIAAHFGFNVVRPLPVPEGKHPY